MAFMKDIDNITSDITTQGVPPKPAPNDEEFI